MNENKRFDLLIEANEKAAILYASKLTGTSMANFVRSAAKEKAQQIIDKESRLSLSQQDFEKFSKALNHGFTPNEALKNAIAKAGNLEIA
ncbi:DUF1778 domain-containing protein [Polynucleobacter rarus]|jgi:uncharacterized protein (DUF1778 family)|uniref:type II toxin-antitoxin system TacA family antitoxin n=1 Tax=Polynucleobacter rarus TaxID=556055 RepID=UPI000D3E7988|nr:DUF1778 domain-containing protein [Polynucleobacter rarus]